SNKIRIAHQLLASNSMVPDAKPQNLCPLLKGFAFSSFFDLPVGLTDQLCQRLRVNTRALSIELIDLPAGVEGQKLHACIRKEIRYSLLPVFERIWLLTNLLKKSSRKFLQTQRVLFFISIRNDVPLLHPLLWLQTSGIRACAIAIGLITIFYIM